MLSPLKHVLSRFVTPEPPRVSPDEEFDGKDEWASFAASGHPVGVEGGRWAYRLLLDREPESAEVLETMAGFSSPVLRQVVLTSDEFGLKNPNVVLAEPIWVITETEHGFRAWVDLRDMAICRNILLNQYEQWETEFVKKNLSAGEFVIDIGANIGYYTLLMASIVGPSGKVLAFEPFDELRQVAQRSVDENGFSDWVSLRSEGLSNESGQLFLRHAPDSINFGGAFIVDTDEPIARHAHKKIEVTRLDDIEIDGTPSFVKIDIEGAEPKALEGAADTLRKHRPVVLCEIHPHQLKTVSDVTPAEFISLVEGLGYKVH